jgi:hypothetical protein
VGQWCEEYADKLKDKSLRVCEYHGAKRKKYQKNPKLLGAFDLVVTTYETLGREYANAEKASLKKAESEPWVCELPTSVWNAEKEMDEYTGPPCKHSNDRKHQECQKCGGNVATVAVKQRASNMRRTGEIQAPIEKFFWNRIIGDESHGKRFTCWVLVGYLLGTCWVLVGTSWHMLALVGTCWSLFCIGTIDTFTLFFSCPTSVKINDDPNVESNANVGVKKSMVRHGHTVHHGPNGFVQPIEILRSTNMQYPK